MQNEYVGTDHNLDLLTTFTLFLTMLHRKVRFCSYRLQVPGREISSGSGFIRAMLADIQGKVTRKEGQSFNRAFASGARRFLAPDHATGPVLKKMRKKE